MAVRFLALAGNDGAMKSSGLRSEKITNNILL